MMKKTKMFMLVLTSAVLALTPVTANAAEAAPSQVTETVIATPTPTPKKPQKKGWVKTKSGIRRYYRKGKRLTGFQKIAKNYFYFSAKGTLLKNTTVNKGYRGFTYYIDNKSHVIGRKKGSTYYTASGKRMTQVQIANLRSKQIAAEITNSSMSKSQKLQTCFNWVIKGYYNIWRDFDQGGKDWPATFANDHFLHTTETAFLTLAHLLTSPRQSDTRMFMYVPTLCKATTMPTHGVRSTGMFMTRFSQRQRVTASITVQPMVLMDFTRF
ncbi:MAG: hypothetical protein ACLRZ5_16945 [Ruminococcus sp.]